MNDAGHYAAIVAELRADVESLAEPLRAQTWPVVERLALGEFGQICALLPRWLRDLLPVTDDICRRLGLAHLYGWWYYVVQDALIDGEATPAALLGAHLALLRQVEIYRQLGLADAPCWAEFQRLARSSAACYAVEIDTRFRAPDELTPARLAALTVEWIMERGSPFYFNTIAQLHLAGLSPAAPLYGNLLGALRCFTAARQISDDASDWLDDLRAGQLNFVSARLMRALYASGRATNGADLDLDRLVGHQLANEPFWQEIAGLNQALYRQALDHLAPYGESRLAALIRRQMERDAGHWAAASAERAGLRGLLGV